MRPLKSLISLLESCSEQEDAGPCGVCAIIAPCGHVFESISVTQTLSTSGPLAESAGPPIGPATMPPIVTL